MTATDGFKIDIALVSRLVAAQFPQWADLPIRPVAWDGWDNRTFHLGERMKVRLPSAEGYVAQVEKEHRWLPRLAPLLPLAVPTPLALGRPGFGYPWPWSVYGWIEGETASVERIADLAGFATELGRFLVALQRIDAAGGPLAGEHNFFRGGPLSVYDAETRQTIAAVARDVDAGGATEVWEAALAARWRGPPVWVHGDIAVGNLLVKEGGLRAIIDFGSSGVGDPACDLVITWTFFAGESRDAFRAAVPADSATWARARGWALWKALITFARSGRSHPAEKSPRDVIAEVLAEHRQQHG
ncbi:aminoglycoside phosphotransferase [Sorangium cellulosum]|uniref:Aminoglycoside phosphotransferase n=1 Tax=Sorangium cellulosum TaxID=56 RepID=A0A150QZN0_SORCE|nr:aminoglycoside phosphotransferase [Sorangium cellulosum]